MLALSYPGDKPLGSDCPFCRARGTSPADPDSRRLGCVGSVIDRANAMFTKLVNERAGGKLKINFIQGEQLGTDMQVIEQMMRGSVHVYGDVLDWYVMVVYGVLAQVSVGSRPSTPTVPSSMSAA